MKHLPAVVAASILSVLGATASHAQNYYMRSSVVTKTPAQTAPARTTSACDIQAGKMVMNLTGPSTLLGDVTVAFTGSYAEAKPLIQAHCESFKETTMCEGFQPSAGKLRLRAFKATGEIGDNNYRIYPYGGRCTPA